MLNGNRGPFACFLILIDDDDDDDGHIDDKMADCTHGTG